jgi:hypothetical protein
MTWSPSLSAICMPDDDRFLADIEVTEAADEAHAVELAGLLLETAGSAACRGRRGAPASLVELGDGTAGEVFSCRLCRVLRLDTGRGLARRHSSLPHVLQVLFRPLP